jgi:AAA family ATP:ADP antiporter
MLQRLLSPLVEVRKEETGTVFLMFLYSFLAMMAYNIVQPITRSKFITAHGAENLPYVLLVSVFFIGLLMQGYSRLGSLLPGRWLVPVTQGAMVAILVAFWMLFGTPREGVAAAFYWFGQIYGILLISQFWTLANLIFDPRQAKRVFGFIGAGSSLGGLVGGSITAFLVELVGTTQLVLASALTLALCALVTAIIVSRARNVELSGLERAAEEKGVGGKEAFRMLRESRHLQIIAVVIALTSVGAGLIDQQLSMATEAFKGRTATDAMTAVLGQVQVYTSAIGFVIQIALTSRIQRLLGVGFALTLLPLGLGTTAVIILLNAALWAPMLARVMDKSVRYTVDKTSREILFLPLPGDLKHKAKPFVDVTVDRVGRAFSALLLLLLIEPWGLSFGWQQISWASLGVMAFWLVMVGVAKRGYLRAFRTSLERRDVRAADVGSTVADLSTDHAPSAAPRIAGRPHARAQGHQRAAARDRGTVDAGHPAAPAGRPVRGACRRVRRARRDPARRHCGARPSPAGRSRSPDCVGGSRRAGGHRHPGGRGGGRARPLAAVRAWGVARSALQRGHRHAEPAPVAPAIAAPAAARRLRSGRRGRGAPHRPRDRRR